MGWIPERAGFQEWQCAPGHWQTPTVSAIAPAAAVPCFVAVMGWEHLDFNPISSKNVTCRGAGPLAGWQRHPHTQHHCSRLACFPLQHVFLTRAGSEYRHPALSHMPVEGSRSAAWVAPGCGSVRSSFCRVRGAYKTPTPAADMLPSTQVLE